MFHTVKEYIRIVYFSLYNAVDQIFSNSKLKDGDYLCNYPVNYYSQWESRNLNKSIELHIIKAEDDPLWENSGALTREEYGRWSWNICAIACFKMVSDNFGINSKKIESVFFAKQNVKYGVYKENKEEIKGIFWKSFQEFLFKNYKIQSYIARFLTTKRITQLLLDNQIVFLSVSPFFHRSENGTKSTKRSGHIIIVHGFVFKNRSVQGFFVKDPGAWIENNSQECFVSTKKILLNYSGRAFIIKRSRISQ